MRFLMLFFFVGVLSAQKATTISGSVLSQTERDALPTVIIALEGVTTQVETKLDGTFLLETTLEGQHILQIALNGYQTKRIPLFLEGNPIDLGSILLKRNITLEQTDNLITLTDADLSDDAGTIENATGLLQASRDVFLTRAAFDFGQAFFRVRGYDSQNAQVLINGMPMNKFLDGRPQWNNWGGLNDVVRNQEFTNGLEANDYTFGGILGNTNINTRPSKLRPGTRLSASASNRTYAGRLMATFNSGKKQNGLMYAVSASRRWAESGYIDGTLYDAYSVFGTIEFEINPQNTLMATAISARNRRGRSSAITEEVFELAGNQYNPYWGNQDNRVRNSRERDIFEPIFMLNHFFEGKKLKITSGIAYQFGTNARSRLGFFNAPNPDPTYYRNLPSFYINNSTGADFTNADLARDGFQKNQQLNWGIIYAANQNSASMGKAAYVLYDDVVDANKLLLNTVANFNISSNFQFDAGLGYQQLSSENYAEIQDLLGVEFHEDIDPFSNTINDVSGSLNKTEGEVFNYNYDIKAAKFNGFVQLRAEFGKWNGFISTQIDNIDYQRNGLFENERFSNNSLGKSDKFNFSNFGIKAGIGHQITGRHWVKAKTAFVQRAPVLQNVFVNPRENNVVVPNLKTETITAVDASYFIRFPDFTGRITGFYSRFQNTTDINFFFVDSGLGSDFVQEVITDLDKLHMGIEAGFEYEASPDVKLSLAANVGKYVYASDPLVTINFDTAGQDEPIDVEGNLDLGIANIKDYKLAQGPQKAVAFGVEYRDPTYWWVGATANYLANNYANISTITRTQSFLLNPDTGERFVDATDENVQHLLRQSKLDDFYLLNLVGGKSWLKNGKYVSAFVSINNVFDTVFRTGGYEQSRNGNFGQLQQDNLRDNPTFAPKYWYGYGRTYFLNVAFSF